MGIQENVNRSKWAKFLMEAIDTCKMMGNCKNGIGIKRAAKVLGYKPGTESFNEARNSLKEAAEYLVDKGVLQHYRGRNGGSYCRLLGDENPHVADTWGGRTGHEAGTIPAERNCLENIERFAAEDRSDAEFGGIVRTLLRRLREEFPRISSEDDEEEPLMPLEEEDED